MLRVKLILYNPIANRKLLYKYIFYAIILIYHVNVHAQYEYLRKYHINIH